MQAAVLELGEEGKDLFDERLDPGFRGVLSSLHHRHGEDQACAGICAQTAREPVNNRQTDRQAYRYTGRHRSHAHDCRRMNALLYSKCKI